jgi:hypothetical protein
MNILVKREAGESIFGRRSDFLYIVEPETKFRHSFFFEVSKILKSVTTEFARNLLRGIHYWR